MATTPNTAIGLTISTDIRQHCTHRGISTYKYTRQLMYFTAVVWDKNEKLITAKVLGSGYSAPKRPATQEKTTVILRDEHAAILQRAAAQLRFELKQRGVEDHERTKWGVSTLLWMMHHAVHSDHALSSAWLAATRDSERWQLFQSIAAIGPISKSRSTMLTQRMLAD